MYRQANAGHVGCSLSAAEVMTYIHFGWMQPQDEFILSKGHAAALLYSVLAEKGVLSAADIDTFYQDNTLLAAHPPAGKLPGIPFATGSLGHGLSLAAAMALADRLATGNKKIFCLTSDGELNEGSIWEAASFIVHQQLRQVIWWIDRNGLQGFGKTEEVMQLEPLAQKLQAWGFQVITCQGHDIDALQQARRAAEAAERPVAIIAQTTKGLGWERLQNQVDCHYLPMTDDDYAAILQAIENKATGK